jgi:hypothetical protein
MSTLGGTALTLLDVLKMTDPDGKASKIVEILMQENGLLEDMTWLECNDGESHQTSIRTGLPTATWRRYNEGVQPSKGTNAQVRAQTGMLEANSIIDRDLAEKGGNLAANRASEAVAHILGMSNQMATAVLYEDERTNQNRITGLAAHYSSISTATAASAQNVIDGGGSGSDCTSIWLVGWGPDAITGLYPKGAKAGLQHEDRGLVTVADATGITGGTYKGYRERFSMQCGLAVPDWTCGGRIANIDVSAINADSGDADLVTAMIRLSERVRRRGARYAWLMNRKARAHLRHAEAREGPVRPDLGDGRRQAGRDVRRDPGPDRGRDPEHRGPRRLIALPRGDRSPGTVVVPGLRRRQTNPGGFPCAATPSSSSAKPRP